MLKNYFRSLYRIFIRNKFYSLINISGLSIGIATSLFILFYIQDELSYDKYHKNYDRIFRIESDFAVNNNHNRYATAPIPLGPALKREMPEIEEFARLDVFGNSLFRYQDKEYFETNFYIADSTVFKVFTHRFLNGNPDHCLVEPNSIVLTESIALKYFGDEDPMGKILATVNGYSYKVTGIIEDLPQNSHLKFDALVSVSTWAEEYSTTKPSRFWRIGTFTFIMLQKDSGIEAVMERFPDFYIKYMKDLGDQFNVTYEMTATPLAQTHFRKGLDAERPTGNKAYILIFSVVAIFVLVIAIINYMNMATARSAARAREVGVRKVLGADKNSLIRQFLTESMVLSFIALIISLILVWILMPEFNEMIGKEITLKLLFQPEIFLIILAITIIVGLVSGSYPAFYISSFSPQRVLKGDLSRSGRTSILLRRILVVIQFFMAIVMISGTMVVSSQLQFLKNKDLGFDRNNLVVLEMQDETFYNNIPAFKKELLQSPDILSVSNSMGIPGSINWIANMRIEQETGMTDRAIIYDKTDFDFAKVFQLEFVQGRDFDESMGTDALEAAIINETAAYDFGWTKDPIGKKIHFDFKQDGTGGRMLKVIGVIKDFNFKSLHNNIEPLLIMVNENPAYYLTCKIREGNRHDAVYYIEEKWKNFGIKLPFSYKLLSENLDDMYKAEEKIDSIFFITTIVAIFLALLGLLGLSSYIAEQKTKEMGIRKIHGATLWDILLILYREFARLILIAFIIAVPVAWWRLNLWLESGFQYYKPLDWMVFIYAGTIAFLIGMLTISYFIIKAASRNPVEAIKYE
ncbi:MAG: ABC transporter permease [Bacteroidales bacterium]|nr:ABC transporter permease [Bacteroidales bacterium]